MSREQSAEEVRVSYIEKMGQELGEHFHAISEELTLIHLRWKQYRTLFGEKPSRIDLLNEAAPFFFGIIQNVLFEDTLLAIARIVGPCKSINRSNLTVERFPDLLTDQNLRDKIGKLIKEAKTSAEFAVDWRNRHLAHRDLDLILGQSPKELALATREKVEKSLSALRDILDCIQLAYCDATTAYDFSPTPGDADELLYVLQSGLLRERDRQACWARGERHDDDVNPPEAV